VGNNDGRKVGNWLGEPVGTLVGHCDGLIIAEHMTVMLLQLQQQ